MRETCRYGRGWLFLVLGTSIWAGCGDTAGLTSVSSDTGVPIARLGGDERPAPADPAQQLVADAGSAPLDPDAWIRGLLRATTGSSRSPAAASSSRSTAHSAADSGGALELLREYEAAYRARDIRRLERVWRMDPFERMVMKRVFRDYQSLKVSVDPGRVREHNGDLLIDFDQTTSLMEAPLTGRPLRASLMRRSGGEWVVHSIRLRHGPSLRSPLPSGGPSGTRSLKGTMNEFARAFESRSLERLSLIWSMSPQESQAIEDLFQRADTLEFRVDLRGAIREGDRATVDFDQSFKADAHPKAREGFDRLRARVKRESDGRLVIARVTAR